jgi:hypothetical protein
VSGRNIFPNLNLSTAPNHDGASGNLSFRDRHIVIWVNDQSNSLKVNLHTAHLFLACAR